MKIQLNDLAALERLIGGDTELEMEIRRSIVDDFTKKHLKGLAETLPIQTVRDELLGAIRNGNFWGARQFDLKPEIKTAIEAQVRSSANEAITKLVEETIKTMDIPTTVNAYLTSGIKREVTRLVDAKLAEVRAAL